MSVQLGCDTNMGHSEKRRFCTMQLHPSLELISNKPRIISKGLGKSGLNDYGPIVSKDGKQTPGVPLCIILGWFAAQKRHLMKFVDVYLAQDFDVLLLTSPPSSLVRPMGSLKLRSKLLLKFFKCNDHVYEEFFVHGFSVGALVWGTFLFQVDRNLKEFEGLQRKIRGQIWDSLFIDAGRLCAVGSSVLFPDRHLLQKVMNAYGLATMTTLDNPGRRAAEAFHFNNFKSPCLIVSSEDDQVALSSVVAACAAHWQERGSTVYWKMWQSSPHVCHMKENSDEYKALWRELINTVGLLKYPGRFQINSSGHPK